jgi:hypothetical protein
MFGYIKKKVKPYILKLASRFVKDPSDLAKVIADSEMFSEEKNVGLEAYQREGLLKGTVVHHSYSKKLHDSLRASENV